MENKTVTAKEEALGFIVASMRKIFESSSNGEASNAEAMFKLAKAYALVENAGRDDTGKRLDNLEKQVKDLAKYCH